jgi:hypothetical protein
MRTIILLSNSNWFYRTQARHRLSPRPALPVPNAFDKTQWAERGMLKIAQLIEINILRLMDYGFGLAHRLHRPIVYK